MNSSIQAFVSSTEELIEFSKNNSNNVFVLKNNAHISWDSEDPIVIIVGGRNIVEIELAGKSRPTVICTDNAIVKMSTRYVAAPSIEGRKSTNIRLTAMGESSPQINLVDQSRIVVFAREGSKPLLTANDFSSHMVIVQDQSKPRCDYWPAKWVAGISDIYIGQDLICFGTFEEARSAIVSFYSEWLKCHNHYIACMRVAGAIPKICRNVIYFRWIEGAIHFELPDITNPRPWYTTIKNQFIPMTETARSSCARFFID